MIDIDTYLNAIFNGDNPSINVYKLVFGNDRSDVVTESFREALVRTAIQITIEGSSDYEQCCAESVLTFLNKGA